MAWGKLITYPDVSVVCGAIRYTDDDRDTITTPTVIVKVLSPTTSDYDRGEKSRLYRMLDPIEEYLLIEQHAIDIEHYRRLPNGHLELATIHEHDAVIRFESLSCDLPVSEVYLNVDRL